MTNLPKFSTVLLHPRYWLAWLGIDVLWLVVQLPYPVIYRLGCGLGKLALRFIKQRVRIVHRNLELCFPEMNEQEHRKMVVKNFESVDMDLIKTGIAWFWPDRRIARWTEVIDMEHIHDVQAQKRGILSAGVHFLILGLGVRQFSMQEPGVGIYRPNGNPLIDWLQTWGRLRSNKSMLDHRDLKGMTKALKKGKVVWYTPDHDYGPRSSVFVLLFAVEQAATMTGTWMLAQMSGVCLVPSVPRRKPDDKGYQLVILPPGYSPPLDDVETTAMWVSKVVEKCIMMTPGQYVWSHRRFKTRPGGVPSRC